MQNNLSQSLDLETSPTDKNLYIFYKKCNKRKGFIMRLPVAEVLINSGPEPFVSFCKKIILSDEEKDFINAKAKELELEKLLSN